jgi:hypothetical protein
MAYQVIKQSENDKGYSVLAIFDSGTDRLVVWDATEGEVLEWFAERAAQQARKGARSVTQKVIDGKPRDIYRQFTLDWKEALAIDAQHGGEASADLGGELLP